jgi:hypothetical protein
MPDVQETMMDLYREDKILVTQQGIAVDKNFLPKGPVRITSKTEETNGSTKDEYEHT